MSWLLAFALPAFSSTLSQTESSSTKAPAQRTARCKSLNSADLVAAAKTIFVVRVLARVQGDQTAAYRVEVLKTLKGKRVEQFSFDLSLPTGKLMKNKFSFETGANCQMRGNLVADNRYIIFVDKLNEPGSIIPVASVDDDKIDQIQALVATQAEGHHK